RGLLISRLELLRRRSFGRRHGAMGDRTGAAAISNFARCPAERRLVLRLGYAALLYWSGCQSRSARNSARSLPAACSSYISDYGFDQPRLIGLSAPQWQIDTKREYVRFRTESKRWCRVLQECRGQYRPRRG